LNIERVFVSGGTGLVGRNLTDMLSASGLEFFAPSSGEVNLLDAKPVFKALEAYRPDLIIHCAGTVGGIAANVAEPYSYCDQNTQMGLNLVRASKDLHIKNLINLGSSCMYPAEARNPLKESAILTGILEQTNEGYALAKIITSRLCDYVSRQYGLSYKTIIPCNLYGRYDHFDPFRSHLIPGAILKIHKAVADQKQEVVIWGDGRSRREFMYAGDFAAFLMFAINRFDDLPHTMNVGLGIDYSVNEYYAEIAKVVGYTGAFLHDVSQPAGMKQKLVDVTAQRSLGWMPTTSLFHGLQNTYEFMKEANI